MRSKILIISLMLLIFLSGCTEDKPYISGKSIECQRLQDLWESEQIIMDRVQVSLMRENTFNLMSQHKWLIHRLDKCLEKLEAERALEPITRESPLKKYGGVFPLPSETDPNITEKHPRQTKPFFEPYQPPDIQPLPEKPKDVRTLRCLMNLDVLAVNLYMYSTDGRIGNFEKRLKRLEEHMDR